uniref:Uncharacterized protein n=1 Tax=Heterorhabditis bacteriophora TaxID=37862 RepID=A0A1I7XAC6_HETBA
MNAVRADYVYHRMNHNIPTLYYHEGFPQSLQQIFQQHPLESAGEMYPNYHQAPPHRPVIGNGTQPDIYNSYSQESRIIGSGVAPGEHHVAGVRYEDYEIPNISTLSYGGRIGDGVIPSRMHVGGIGHATEPAYRPYEEEHDHTHRHGRNNKCII